MNIEILEIYRLINHILQEVHSNPYLSLDWNEDALKSEKERTQRPQKANVTMHHGLLQIKYLRKLHENPR